MKKAIIVGSGAGGATAAKELQGVFDVTVLEAGKEFRPFSIGLPALERWRQSGLLFDEREISLIFPGVRIRKTQDMVFVNGKGWGGTTTIATGNALRLDRDLRRLGINLDAEFEEISREIPISTEHAKRWRPLTRRLFEIFKEMGHEPKPTPKLGDYTGCRGCGRCVLGCPYGVKWDSRLFLRQALEKGARLNPGFHVEKVVIEKGETKGVLARRGLRTHFFPADLVVLAAGGFGTPVILKNSGISCPPTLFVDPVLCVAAEWRDAHLESDVSMPFVAQQQGFMLSPYFDFLSFFFNKRWGFPAKNIVSLMIKLADENVGSVSGRGVQKLLSDKDKSQLEKGVSTCKEILVRLGVEENKIFRGTVNAGHPGGTFPLTSQEAVSLHHASLPLNLYLADATLLPRSLGNPPILTIIALAKRVSKLCRENMG